MVYVIRQRPMNILHPYAVEVYVTKDGSEACLSLNPSKAFCAQKGAVNEVKLELEFSRYETYEDRIREVYRSKGLLAFTTVARECKTNLTAFHIYVFVSKVGRLSRITTNSSFS